RAEVWFRSNDWPAEKPLFPRQALRPAQREITHPFLKRPFPDGCSSAGKAFVFDLVRLIRVDAQPPLLVGFIILEIAFEPFDMAVALEGQHVGGDTVQEPAVMADDHG